MAEANDNIVQTPEVEEDFSESFAEDDTVALHVNNAFSDELNTHQRIKNILCGTIMSLDKGYARVNLLTTNEMIVDELGLIHSGFVFSAADYAAVAAVNEENIVVIGAKTSFLAPAKVGDLLEFEAKAKFEDSRKREITVTGKINDIKIFEGIFHAVVLEKHIFKTKIKNARRDY
ncbi:PaaI family thioesterase [Sulfurospirillum sp. T05]|uniref:PaaI family thioesterase n=1 Tax=Sulfurospirillum tamanense TaxID=2813362 RepID=A0ABS2WQ30_9BACT|nr:hotdog domain-containing protein [Sulfurospirillum tamanensis]MBN2963738.1 PaaI family thioesterase [Sulfurospirillum tamanensis]